MTHPALPFTGRTVLVTGNIDDFTRDQARDSIVALGGEAALGVTKKVDLVILGEGAGISKTAKARDYDLPVLTGEAFAALAADPSLWDGTPVGISFADWDALQGPVPVPEPVDPEARNHWAAMAVVHVQEHDGQIRRQVRMLCECGHRWMRRELFGDDSCPRPAVPRTDSPWDDPEYLQHLR
jgi:hypothetical protein